MWCFAGAGAERASRHRRGRRRIRVDTAPARRRAQEPGRGTRAEAAAAANSAMSPYVAIACSRHGASVRCSALHHHTSEVETPEDAFLAALPLRICRCHGVRRCRLRAARSPHSPIAGHRPAGPLDDTARCTTADATCRPLPLTLPSRLPRLHSRTPFCRARIKHEAARVISGREWQPECSRCGPARHKEACRTKGSDGGWACACARAMGIRRAAAARPRLPRRPPPAAARAAVQPVPRASASCAHGARGGGAICHRRPPRSSSRPPGHGKST
jgi:hypothetical protein